MRASDKEARTGRDDLLRRLWMKSIQNRHAGVMLHAQDADTGTQRMPAAVIRSVTDLLFSDCGSTFG